ncbi:MAG: F0F1 ATP synthase subunit epsilon [Fimbriimonas ginsengisoli]|nr:F0F1 ATP synthase subunit epsilon [Fimbriimonas ginsengisoli]
MPEFHLAVVAPDRSVVEEPVTSTILPGSEGYFGVLAGHAPTIASLKAGLLEYVDMGDNRHYVAVSGGFAEVTGSRVTVLADAAERAKEIDIERAERALEEARRALRGETSDVPVEQATGELERAVNRLRVAKLV